MLIENSIGCTNSCLPVTEWIVGKADAWCRIPDMSWHTALRHTNGHAALHDTAEMFDTLAWSKIKRTGVGIHSRHIRLLIGGGIKVIGEIVFFGVETEHTYT